MWMCNSKCYAFSEQQLLNTVHVCIYSQYSHVWFLWHLRLYSIFRIQSLVVIYNNYLAFVKHYIIMNTTCFIYMESIWIAHTYICSVFFFYFHKYMQEKYVRGPNIYKVYWMDVFTCSSVDWKKWVLMSAELFFCLHIGTSGSHCDLPAVYQRSTNLLVRWP